MTSEPRHDVAGSGTAGSEGGSSKTGGKTSSSARSWLILGGVLVAAAVLLVLFPERRDASLAAFGRFFLEMVTVIPGVLVIMGLFKVWIPREAITRYLGRGSGAGGVFLAAAFGALPTGPLYAAFPLTKGLVDKGASPANVFVFLSAWACIKIPQELVELQFLGWRFMVARLSFTLGVVAAMAFIFQWLLDDRRSIAAEDV